MLNLVNAVLYTACAVLWMYNGVMNGRGYCFALAAVWFAGAVIWFVRYWYPQNKEKEK